MKIKLFVIAVVWLMSGVLSSAQAQSQLCGCADAKHMLFRIKEANAAINEYKKQIQNYQAQGNSSGNPVRFTQEEYRNNLQPAVKTVLTNVKSAEPPPSPLTAGAKTDPHSCSEPEISGGTPCLQEALRKHESHHSNSCSLKRPPRTNPVSDYRDAMTMVEVIEEEIVGYTLERAYLASELAKLPDKCKPPVWYLYYEVTVAGDGSKTRAGGFRDQITWKVLHKYSGNIELNQPSPQLPIPPQQMALMSPAQIMAAAQKYPKGSVTSWRHKPLLPVLSSLYVPMDVLIKDEVMTFVYDPGEGITYEQTKTTETWGGDATDGVKNGFEFLINSVDKNYNISIPIKPSNQLASKIPPPVKNIKKEVIDRTEHGYGGAPTHEEKTPTNTKVSFDSFEIPTVAGLLENAVVHHSANLPLDFTLDTLTFDSGLVKPTLPYLKGLPDAEKSVRVRVYYRVSRLPEN